MANNNKANLIFKIYYLLKTDFYYVPLLIILFLLSSLIDVVGIGLVAPYVSIIVQPEIILSNELFQKIYIFIFGSLHTKEKVLIYLGYILISIFLLKTIVAIILNYIILLFCFNQGYKLKLMLMYNYQNMDFLTFIRKNTSFFTNNLQVVVDKYSIGVLQAVFRVISESIVIIAILIFLSYQSIEIVILAAVIFGTSALAYDFLFRKRVEKYGAETNKLQRNIFKNIQEGLDGFKEVRLLGKESYFFENIKNDAKRFASINTYVANVNLLPRYLIELLLILFVVSSIILGLYLNNELTTLIPLLSMFGVASIRIVPSLNKIISSISLIRYGTNFVDLLYDDILNFHKNDPFYSKSETENFYETNFKKLNLVNCTFGYSLDKNIFENINLEINSGEFIGIHGESGSGKSTLINILLGLIKPTSGEIFLNDEDVTGNYKKLNNIVAYLPQEVFLLDDTIRKNICFGQNANEINEQKIRECLSLVKLDKFIDNLDDGINTSIGQKGLQISGGQRQRLSLARALYFDRQIFVLDEATNALDTSTEQKILEELLEFKGKKTVVIISHNLKNLEICDKIYITSNRKLHLS